MTLRNRTLLATGLFLIFLLTVVYSLTDVIISKGFGRIESRWAQDNLARVEQSFKSLIDNLVVKSADWAVWSDTYEFVADLNDAYKESNLGDVSFENLQINYMLYINDRKEVVFQKRYDLAKRQEIPIPEEFLKHFSPSSPFLIHKNLDVIHSGVVMVDGAPVIFSARPILTSEHTGPSRGTLVFAREISQGQLSAIKEMTKMNVRIVPMNDTHEASEIAQLSVQSNHLIRPENKGLFEGFVLITDALGKPAFVFMTEMERDIQRQADSTKAYLASFFIGISVVFLIVFVLLMQKLIFSRLTLLNNDIEELEDPSKARRFIAVQGHDELGKVAWTINHMLAHIQQSNEKLEDRMKELDQAKRAAEHASRAKSQFLANMSHEIRTPLNSILGYADLLQRSTLTAEQKKYLESVTHSSKLLLSVISDILDISKIEESRLELEHVNMDLRHVIDGTLNIIRPNAESKGLKLEYTIEPDVPQWVKGDPTRLRQILINLLGNAVKFTSRGSVRLDVQREPSLDAQDIMGVRICVRDSGIGIPADKLQAIFDPFIQADTSTTRKFGGSGLGLTICRNLVQMMGGKIWVESEMDKGSNFIFTMRLARGTVQQVVKEELPSEDQGMDWKSVRILVVEDSTANQQLLGAIFSLIGCKADYANNGREAIDRLQKDSDYDLCLMDMQMPYMGGEDATLYIRQNISRDLPIIALTAAVMKEDREGAFKAGVNDFLAKPIEMDKLKAAIIKYAKRTVRAPRVEAYDLESLSKEIGLPIEDYKEILKSVADNADADIAALTQAMKAKDGPGVKSLSHRLKGMYANMRLKKLSSYMASVEAAMAKPEQWETAESECDRFKEEMKLFRRMFS